MLWVKCKEKKYKFSIILIFVNLRQDQIYNTEYDLPVFFLVRYSVADEYNVDGGRKAIFNRWLSMWHLK